MQPRADAARGDDPRFAIVRAGVGFVRGGRPVEALDFGKVDAVLGQVGLALGLVPVPNLYAYIKFAGKGECGVGKVKRGLRGGCAVGNGEHVGCALVAHLVVGGLVRSECAPYGWLLDSETVLFDGGDGIATPTPLRLVQLAEYVRGLQGE